MGLLVGDLVRGRGVEIKILAGGSPGPPPVRRLVARRTIPGEIRVKIRENLPLEISTLAVTHVKVPAGIPAKIPANANENCMQWIWKVIAMLALSINRN